MCEDWQTYRKVKENITYLRVTWITLYLYFSQEKSFLRLYLFCLATIALWYHLNPFRTQKWNAVAPMVVWEFPCESRTLLNFYLEKPEANASGFLLSVFKKKLHTETSPVSIHFRFRGASEVVSTHCHHDNMLLLCLISYFPVTSGTATLVHLSTSTQLRRMVRSVWVFFSLCESRILLNFTL